VADARAFERWRRPAEQQRPRLLFLTREQLMRRSAAEVSADRFPDTLTLGSARLPLSYHFDPASARDGVTVTLPGPLLAAARPEPFDWLVPGLLEEKMTALIRSLPKSLRRNFVPAPEYARACTESVSPGEGSLTAAMAAVLQRITGIRVPAGAWQPGQLPAHLHMRYRIVDETGRELTAGRDLQQIRDCLDAEQINHVIPTAAAGPRLEGIVDWDFGTLAETEEVQRAGIAITVYPTLADQGDSVAIRLSSTAEEAGISMRAGLKRLVRIRCHGAINRLRRTIPGIQAMCLQYRAVASCEQLRGDLVEAVLERCFVDEDSFPRDREAFARLVHRGQAKLDTTATQLCRLVAEILTLYHEVDRTIRGPVSPAMIGVYSDLRSQLDHLVHAGFVAATPHQRLPSYPRYLRGMRLRLQKLRLDPIRDRARSALVAPLWCACTEKLAGNEARGRRDLELERYRWMVEELRMSVFAQEIGAGEPVSEKRLAQQWRKVG
jgi:ATP-dependent helicase HrpA